MKFALLLGTLAAAVTLSTGATAQTATTSTATTKTTASESTVAPVVVHRNVAKKKKAHKRHHRAAAKPVSSSMTSEKTEMKADGSTTRETKAQTTDTMAATPK